ncbi:MAG: hypothetical protein WBE88_07120, partial [Candidatus Acidiferrales bacterium]
MVSNVEQMRCAGCIRRDSIRGASRPLIGIGRHTQIIGWYHVARARNQRAVLRSDIRGYQPA